MIQRPLIPDNNADEMRAFEAVCTQLHGFNRRLDPEFVDGFLCGLAAGPRPLPAGEWLPALCGDDDTFGRVFADPVSHAQALAALQTRLGVLRRQLDPEALADDPDSMRLNPWMSEWTDEQRAEVAAAAEGELDEDDAAMLHTGAVWGLGFFEAFDQLPQLWALPQEEETTRLFSDTLDQVLLLTLPPGQERSELVQRHYPDGEPSRDDLIGNACIAVQDLRLLWVDFARPPATSRLPPAATSLAPAAAARSSSAAMGLAERDCVAAQAFASGRRFGARDRPRRKHRDVTACRRTRSPHAFTPGGLGGACNHPGRAARGPIRRTPTPWPCR